METLLALFLRCFAFAQFAPIIGDEEVGQRLRLILSFLLAFLLAPGARASQGPLASVLVAEFTGGLLLGWLLGAFWQVLSSTLVPIGNLGGLSGGDGETLALLARLVGISAFLLLGGDHFMLGLLSLRHPLRPSTNWEGFLLSAGSELWITAVDALLPLLAALFLAQLAVALVMRGANVDLSSLVGPAMLGCTFVLLIIWCGNASTLYQDSLNRAANLFARPYSRGGLRER